MTDPGELRTVRRAFRRSSAQFWMRGRGLHDDYAVLWRVVGDLDDAVDSLPV